jgi:hypothetical protein
MTKKQLLEIIKGLPDDSEIQKECQAGREGYDWFGIDSVEIRYIKGEAKIGIK